MNIITAIFNGLFRIPLVRNVFGGLFLSAIVGICLKLGMNSIIHYVPFITKLTQDMFLSLIIMGCLVVNMWTIGQKLGVWIWGKTLMGTIVYVGVAYTNHKYIHYKANDKNLYFSVIGVMILAPYFLKLITFRKRSNLNKTMTDIDNFGVKNGKKENKLAGDLFEAYIRDLYQAIGYDAQVAFDLKASGKGPKGLQGLSGDGGADVIATSFKLGERLVIQCKHYSSNVGVEACYQANGALKLYEGTHAVVVTNQFFTEEAKLNAEVNNIILIDRFALTRLIGEVAGHVQENSPEPMLIARLFKKKNNNHKEKKAS